MTETLETKTRMLKMQAWDTSHVLRVTHIVFIKDGEAAHIVAIGDLDSHKNSPEPDLDHSM